MILKKIMHFICGHSLEKETAKTNTLIREVEQHEKAATNRLETQANEYRDKAIAYKEKRDAEIKEIITFLNEQIERTEAYTPHLGNFQDNIFICFESWMRISIDKQHIQLLSDRINTKYKMLNFITALQVELNKITQRNERNEWFHMINERPILIESAFIERTVSQVGTSQKRNSESIRHDLSRLKSHSISIQTEIKALRHERDQLIASSRELMEKHISNKADLNEQYRTCSKIFDEIKDKFSERFGSTSTGNSLTDTWIAQIEDGITLQKLFSTHKVTNEMQQKADNDFNEVADKFNAIRSQISENRNRGDFARLQDHKATRDRLYLEFQKIRQKRSQIFIARKVLYERGNELKKMLSKFDLLHPDESIRRIVEIFNMSKDFDVYQVIGVSTREDRRKHYKLKNQNN